MRRVASFLVLLLVFGLLGPAASAQVLPGEPLPPVFNRRDVWFAKTSTPTRITNVDASQGTIPTWDDTKPTNSEPYGAGGVYVANNYNIFTSIITGSEEHDPAHAFTVQGQFTGDLETMAVTMYGYMPWQRVLPCGMGLAWDLKIDGVQILYQNPAEPSAELMVEQVNEDLWAVKFYFTRLYEAMQTYGVETGPDVSHTIYMNATNFYACNEVVWVYDSAEAPGGAIFNLLDPKQLRFYTKVDVFNPPPPIEG